jgi:UPF0716 protein FxsA
MFIKLLTVFIGLPALEIYTMLEFSNIIGPGGTIALVIVTGISGAYLARAQGFVLLKKFQFEISQGRMPADEMLDGLLIFAGGLVLLTPGFWTDLLGFFCLLPATRKWLRFVLRRWLEKKVAVFSVHRNGNFND